MIYRVSDDEGEIGTISVDGESISAEPAALADTAKAVLRAGGELDGWSNGYVQIRLDVEKAAYDANVQRLRRKAGFGDHRS
jgi:hypothetical protein